VSDIAQSPQVAAMEAVQQASAQQAAQAAAQVAAAPVITNVNGKMAVKHKTVHTTPGAAATTTTTTTSTTTSSEAGSVLALKTSQGVSLEHLQSVQALDRSQLETQLLAQGVPSSDIASAPQMTALLQQQQQMRSAVETQNSKNMAAYAQSKNLAPRKQHVHAHPHATQLVPGQASTQVTTTTSTTTSSEATTPVTVAVLKSTPVQHVNVVPGQHGAAPTQTTTTTTSTTTSSEVAGNAQLGQSAGVQGTQSGIQDLYIAGQQQAWASGVGVVKGVPGQAVPEWGVHSWGNVPAGQAVTTAQVQSQVNEVYAQLSPEQQAELNQNVNQFENTLGRGSSGQATQMKGWVAQAAGQQTAQTDVGAGTPQLIPAGTQVTDSSGTSGVVTSFIKRIIGRI
jgi:hypothetical protein